MPTLAPHFALRSVFNRSRVPQGRVMENAGSDAASALGGAKRREDGLFDERRCARKSNESEREDSCTPRCAMSAKVRAPRALGLPKAQQSGRSRLAKLAICPNQTRPWSPSPPSERLNRRCTLKRRSASPPERRSAPARGATLRAAGASPPSIRRAYVPRRRRARSRPPEERAAPTPRRARSRCQCVRGASERIGRVPRHE